jgi:hypothetical protein
LIRFSKRCAERLAIAQEDKKILVQVGLPKEAAPWLTFQVPESGGVPTVAEEWDLPKEFRSFRLIGSDGSGNPIALDQDGHGEVVYLDHENRFARVLMNTSIRQLLESLLAYRKFVKDSLAEVGESAFLNGQTSVVARMELRQELIRIDAAGMNRGNFWHEQLQNLNANAG